MLFMKESSCSHKLSYEGYMELICGLGVSKKTDKPIKPRKPEKK
jgi:hypothetical protein